MVEILQHEVLTPRKESTNQYFNVKSQQCFPKRFFFEQVSLNSAVHFASLVLLLSLRDLSCLCVSLHVHLHSCVFSSPKHVYLLQRGQDLPMCNWSYDLKQADSGLCW